MLSPTPDRALRHAASAKKGVQFGTGRQQWNAHWYIPGDTCKGYAFEYYIYSLKHGQMNAF